MTDKYDFDPKRGHSTAMNARGIAPRPITDAEMREAVARNEDRIRGYGGEYGSPAPPDAETPRCSQCVRPLVPQQSDSADAWRCTTPGCPSEGNWFVRAAPPEDRGREIGRLIDEYRERLLHQAYLPAGSPLNREFGEKMLAARRALDELADAYSRQIEHTNRVRAAYQERCRALDERIAALVRERDELRKAAETALWAWGTSLNIGDDRLIQALEALRAALTPPEARADDQ
jgi:hypothetical protein